MLRISDFDNNSLDINKIDKKKKEKLLPFEYDTEWYSANKNSNLFNNISFDEDIINADIELSVKNALRRDKTDIHDQKTSYAISKKLIECSGEIRSSDETLVIANLEILFCVFCYYTYYNLDLCKLYFACPNKWKGLIAKIFLPETNVIVSPLYNSITHPKNMYFTKIYSNFPFQNPKGAGNGEPLWSSILKKSLNILHPTEGKLSVIIPPGWTSFQNNGMETLLKENIVYAEIQTPALKRAFIGIGSEFSILCIDRSKEYEGVQLLIKDANETYKLDYRKTKRIYIASTKEKCSIFEKVNKKFLDNGVYPIEWGDGRGGDERRAIPSRVNVKNWDELKKDEIDFRYASVGSKKFPFRRMSTQARYNKNEFHWTSRPGLAFYEKKVIFTDVVNCKAFYDNGTLGVGEHCRAIIVNSEEEANIIINILNSMLVRYLSSSRPASGSAGGIASIILSFPKITEKVDLYEYFNFTKEEIQIIEEHV